MQTANASHPLAAARQTAGLSTRKLAALSGVSYVTVSRIENRQVDPRPETLQKLASALTFASGNTVTWRQVRDAPDPRSADITSSWYDPDVDPEAPNLAELALDEHEAIIYLHKPRVDYVDKRGKVVATETPSSIRIRAVGGTVITIAGNHHQTGRGPSGRPRARRSRNSGSGSSDDGPGEPDLPQRGRP